MDEKITILLMEDEPNDVLLLQRALQKNNIHHPVQVLPDGEEGILYLSGEGKYRDRSVYPIPRIIILDLKMPRKGGLEVLEWIKQHRELQSIPTLVLTSSQETIDVSKAYLLGANTYFSKPSGFDELVTLLRTVYQYWAAALKPSP